MSSIAQRKRRGRRVKVRSDVGWTLGGIGLFAAIGVGQWLAEHPAVLVLAALLAVAAGAGWAWWRVQARRLGAKRARSIASYHQMNASDFEHALAKLCWRDGCRDVQVVGGAGDLAADVLYRAPDGRRGLIQAKRYTPGNNVGSREVQCVGGTYRVVHGADVAAVVTTSGYTRDARAYAKQAGIRLFDEAALAAWASGTGPAPWN